MLGYLHTHLMSVCNQLFRKELQVVKKQILYIYRYIFYMFPLLQKVYKSNWEQQREKGFELRLDSLSILTAKAKRDLASDVSHQQPMTCYDYNLNIA